jgi:cell wall-associated NlpC family hydrolase
MRRRPPPRRSLVSPWLVLLGLAWLFAWVASQSTPGQATGQQGGVPAVSRSAAGAVAFARAQRGKPYVWGADGPNAWDCSGLVGGAWRAAGYRWPDLTAAEQYQWLAARGRTVTRSQLRPDDIVFFNTSRPLGHVAIYVGGGRIVEAQQPGVPVHEVPLRTSGWAGAARPGGGVG